MMLLLLLFMMFIVDVHGHTLLHTYSVTWYSIAILSCDE